MYKKLLSLASIVLFSMPVLGQTNQIARFFPAAMVPSGGQANIDKLISGYITPVAEDFGSLGNGGWYNTAETHKRFGFDLSVTMNAISASSNSKSFAVGTLQGVVSDGTVLGGLNAPAPTVYGGEKDFPLFHYDAAGLPNVGTFAGPGGGNISSDVPIGSLAVPSIQGGLGLFANTDLRFRFTPQIKIGSTQTDSWGLGLMHDIKQHIPGIKMAPFSLSLFLAYNQLNASTDLSGLYTGANQEGVGETKGYTAQILISKSIPVLTFYGGIGYNSSSTTYSIKGTYLVDKAFLADGTPFPLNTAPTTLTNPFSKEYSTSGFRATLGLRFKFGPVTLHGDYTIFNSQGIFATGFGFTVR